MKAIKLNFWPKVAVIVFPILLLFVSDRFLKYFFYNNPDFRWDYFLFSFTFEKNFGFAFGLPQTLGKNISQIFLIVLIVLIIVFLINLLVKYFKENNLLFVSGLILIIFGAGSNLIDRLRFGFVIDYISLPLFTVFNLADVIIVGGIGILIIEYFFKNKFRN